MLYVICIISHIRQRLGCLIINLDRLDRGFGVLIDRLDYSTYGFGLIFIICMIKPLGWLIK